MYLNTSFLHAFACCVGLGLASPGEATAQTLIFNTGVDAKGRPLSVGSSDPHWTVSADPGSSRPQSAVASAVFIEFPTRPDSTWIWVSVNPAAVNTPYTFRTTFFLDPEEALTSQLDGRWSVDNIGHIALNGAPPKGTGALALRESLASNYQTFHDFAILGGFVAGINTLDFIATDFGGVAGLNVSGLRISAVPEPVSSALLLMGLATLARRTWPTLSRSRN